MSSPPPSQRQRQSNSPAPADGSSSNNNPAAAAAALAAAAAMKQASMHGVVRICGTSPSECGYCKGARAKTPAEEHSSSQAYSLLGDFMTPETYEGFLYRGWRRSGTYLYKPNNWQSCCPALTIRLPVRKFVPTKSQRKVVRRMDHLLMTEDESSTAARRGHKRKLQDHPVRTSEEELVQSGGVLEQLQQWTQPILQSILQGSNQNINLANLKTLPSFRIRPPQGKKKATSSGNASADTSTVTVCTTICAALAGQSKGALNRDFLSEKLTEQLKSAYTGKAHRLPPQTPDASASPTWIVTDVHRHAKSGQVICDIQIQNSLRNGKHHMSSNSSFQDDASMKDASTSQVAHDKLQDWLHEHGPNMTPFVRMNANDISAAQPPYPFTVETVPAHESALDPQVHKLYFLYQHKVHQDTDPFTCDLTAKNLNSSSSSMGAVGGGAGGGDDAGQLEEDEWSTPATSDGNDIYKGGNNGKLSPPPPPPPAPANGGGGDRNPPGFIDTAKRMLQREYGTVSADRLKQITKSYGSFFQFLVESPFSLPSNGKARVTVTDTPVTAANANPSALNLPAGTYHQQYRVAGMLIAVGVVDILPKGLSSVYLFYHPQFARDLVPLGKYAILQEIDFARSLQLPYYYLGYYIESCTKMRYKAEYRPSELLCPTTYNWVDAVSGQRILQTLSPDHHCCTLYYKDKAKLEVELKEAAKRNKEAAKRKEMEQPRKDEDDMSLEDLTATPNSQSASTSPSVPSSASAPQQPSANHSDNTTAAGTASNAANTTGSKTTRTKSILKKPNPTPFPPNPHVEQVKMDVGVGMPVTLSMLHERGRETVRPLLDEFVKEAGPEISKQCLVRFS